MSSARNIATLTMQLERFCVTCSEGVADRPQAALPFFRTTSDFSSRRGIVRREEFIATSTELLEMRGTADVATIKWPDRNIALVDSVADTDHGRGWITELWQQGEDGEFLIDVSRTRMGSPDQFFQMLSELPSMALPSGLDDFDQESEEKALRSQFKAFREAFNRGNSQGVAALFTPDSDANVAFSFLDGRAQILNGRAAVGEKADRMNPGALVINPASRPQQGALFVDGEPKVIRFLSSTVAVVDGTAAISNIPSAHGFSPREMKGVYTDIWRKTDSGEWLIDGTRPWF